MRSFFVCSWCLFALVGCGPTSGPEASTDREQTQTAGREDEPRVNQAEVSWRLERWPDLGLEAEVFQEAPTNHALYVSLAEWAPSEDERLRIQLDSEPDMPELAPIVEQSEWRSGEVEETTICDQPASLLRVSRRSEGRTPLDEVRVIFEHAGARYRMTWTVESAHAERWADAEAHFLASIRCSAPSSATALRP